jgi:hypothetical protein
MKKVVSANPARLANHLSDSIIHAGDQVMKTVAFNATLFNNNVGISGIAMRNTDGRVFFQADATGLWTELFDADAGRLQLHGRTDLALAQSIVDGNLVVKASRTLQRAA